ncbi:flagellar hook-length control protein FliK [Rhizobium oryzicola]|uniref:Flagellar hook-length control protein FliK n=1 Tax=Rhizobium oryzicola TaxID=1232668 RepID=A0ABT8SS02_9HYPH|nr:flagellar hook-length control protein FliK [Rhizobium oryzicola]MDO1581030.1 flagellar hook-length control protein FliK [Rhizobium oryzicola]
MSADLAGLTGASDTAPVTKLGGAGSKAVDGKDSGFSDALTSLGQGGRRGAQAQADDSATTAGKEVLPQDAAAATPRIDLKVANALRAAALQQAKQSLLKDGGQGQPDVAIDLKGEVAAQKGLLTKDGKPLLDKTRLIGGKDKTDKLSDAEKKAGDEAVDARNATDAADVGSVLNLLAGHAAKAAGDAGAHPEKGAKGNETARTATSARAVGDADKSVDGVHPKQDAQLASLLGQQGASEDTGPDDKGNAGDRAFRFVSSRGVSMDATIGANQDGRAVMETKLGNAANAEGIMVLDARRYLGFNQSPNGASLTAAMSSDPEWTAAMQPGSALTNAAAQSSTGNVVNTLKLQMTPIDLGNVTATLRLVGDELNVHLTVENHSAYKQLKDDSSGMLDALRAQGFAVDQVTVSITPAAQADASAQQGDLGQQALGSGQRQEAGGNRGQSQSQGNIGFGGAAGSLENDIATDTDASSASGGARSGHIYL